MFRSTDPQSTFGSVNVLLSPEKIARLEKNHWAGGFRHKALPILLTNEEIFRPLFCEDNGRPNKPVAATLGVIILKEMFDLTDEAALDNFAFNASWQYALNVEPDEAHVCQKTLHNFRVKMSEAEEQDILTYSALYASRCSGFWALPRPADTRSPKSLRISFFPQTRLGHHPPGGIVQVSRGRARPKCGTEVPFTANPEFVERWFVRFGVEVSNFDGGRRVLLGRQQITQPARRFQRSSPSDEKGPPDRRRPFADVL